MLKFRTQDHYNRYLKDLATIYKPQKRAKREVIEEKKEVSELDLTKPQIIDFDDESGYDNFSDEILKQCKAFCINHMPKNGHTINEFSSDICLTMTIKNTGEIEWPKGFKVITLNTSEYAYESKYNNILIKPGEEIQMDVFVKNPKVAGDYNYIFTLADAAGNAFGTEFEFEFHVKLSYNYRLPQPAYPIASPKRYYGYANQERNYYPQQRINASNLYQGNYDYYRGEEE
jgi:hypothetical protein